VELSIVGPASKVKKEATEAEKETKEADSPANKKPWVFYFKCYIVWYVLVNNNDIL